MIRRVRVLVWGLGAMGSGVARMILKKEGFSIVGLIDQAPAKAGKRLCDLLGLEPNESNKVVVSARPEGTISRGGADVALVATHSFVSEVFPQIKMCLEAGMNVVTTAEEMSYPWASDPDLAAEMDSLARENGVTILGTGINPGFVMDYLAITLAGVCENVTKVKVSRVNDLAPFGEGPMKELGVGVEPADFEKGVEQGTIHGHVGFVQSFGLFEEAFNIRLSRIEQRREPIVTRVPRSTDFVSAQAGQTVGCRQVGFAYHNDRLFIEMHHPQEIRPEAENVDTGDYITIEGIPRIDLQIRPEIPGGIGTIAICVNMIPHVLNASPGLKTMLDLPTPRPILSDVRELIRTEN